MARKRGGESRAERRRRKNREANARWRAKAEVKARRTEQQRWKRRLTRGVCPQCEGELRAGKRGLHDPTAVCQRCRAVWYWAQGCAAERVDEEPITQPITAQPLDNVLPFPGRDHLHWDGWERLNSGRAQAIARGRCAFVAREAERRVLIERITGRAAAFATGGTVVAEVEATVDGEGRVARTYWIAPSRADGTTD